MAKIGRDKREAKLRRVWNEGRRLLKASGGKDYPGFTSELNKFYGPDWMYTEDYLLIAQMDEDDFVAEMLEKFEAWRNREETPTVTTDEIVTTTEAEPKPMQTAIDFETAAISDNIGLVVMELRRIANAMEKFLNIYATN